MSRSIKWQEWGELTDKMMELLSKKKGRGFGIASSAYNVETVAVWLGNTFTRLSLWTDADQ